MVDVNTKGRVIHQGPRGGYYIIVNGRKVYKFVRAAAAPLPVEVNYNKILKNNRARLNMDKIRRYSKQWLGKNIPVGMGAKRAALIIHPNKGNRTNKVNQAKRTALVKLLLQLK